MRGIVKAFDERLVFHFSVVKEIVLIKKTPALNIKAGDNVDVSYFKFRNYMSSFSGVSGLNAGRVLLPLRCSPFSPR